MNKPDWKNAPSWAKYLAMDEDKSWWWYEEAGMLRKNNCGKCLKK